MIILILMILLILVSIPIREGLEVIYRWNKDTHVTFDEDDIIKLLNQWKPTYLEPFHKGDDSLVTLFSNAYFHKHGEKIKNLPKAIKNKVFTDPNRVYTKEQYIQALFNE